jgi:cytochrome c-type biogenesis protein CcmH/NrfF
MSVAVSVVTVVVSAGGLAGASSAFGIADSAAHPSLDDISARVMCPTCNTTLDRSSTPAADRMRSFVRRDIRAGMTRQQVLDDLVREYGGDESILATPPPHGRGLVAWLVPAGTFLLLLTGAGVTLGGWVRRRPRRAADQASSS